MEFNDRFFVNSGQQMAILFAKRGAIVISCDIDEIGNAQTVELITREVPQITTNEKRVFAYKCDIGNRDEVHALVDSIQRDVGDVTILVNNGESSLKMALKYLLGVF